MEYRVIVSNSVERLETEVNKLLRLGWYPAGVCQVTSCGRPAIPSTVGGGEKVTYAQTMILESKEVG